MKYKVETVYEDDDIIALNKPCGLLAISGRGSASGEDNLLSLLREKREAYAAQRMDRDVSGLIVFAKNKKTHKYLCELFDSKKAIRKYYAVIEGRLEKRKGEIDKPIKQGGSGRMFVNFNGKPSVTEYFVMRELRGASLVEVCPLTNRRHQLRAHFYYIKHPILGDKLYGDLSKQENYPRIMLHLGMIEFEMPDGKKMKFKKDPPKEYLDILERLE